ncbi:membrane-associated protein, putative [Bodo saltans]|uniref:Membrane-associated protein, putative n=1 Tax=Bodo saltans TaxID=75058 RepID=A0A0S4ITB4_BODSA|nr:membrane-associated protein, putative [Bodo saltans]|eukprot:CUG06495.1 membrane-associated protein, putative [Bodo saltans]
MLIARVNSSTCVGLDATLIVLGLVVVVGCPFALTTLFIRRAKVEPLHWECRLQPLRQNKSRPSSLYGRLIQPYAAVVLHRAWKWYALSDTGRDLLKRSWVVLLEYRVLWFAALDSGMLVVIAVLAVVGGLDATDSSLCRSVVLVVLALTVCQMLLMLLLRPYTTLFSVVHGAVTLALTSLSIAAQIAFIVSSTTESPHLWLVKASAGCDLAVVGVTAVKMMFDSKDVVDAIRRRLNGNVGVYDSDHIPRDLSIMTLTLINADHDDALVVNYATQSSSTTSLSHRDVVEGSSASGMREDRVSYRSSSTTSSPCSPPMALRSHSAGNSFALSSSFHLERVNARFWDSNGTAHVLRGGEGGSGFVIDEVFDHRDAEM